MSDAPVAASQAAPSRPLEFVVRFGSMRILGVMTAKHPYRYGDQVVTRSSRGTEIATVLCEATPAAQEHVQQHAASPHVHRLVIPTSEHLGS